eukprot:g73384.t1
MVVSPIHSITKKKKKKKNILWIGLTSISQKGNAEPGQSDPAFWQKGNCTARAWFTEKRKEKRNKSLIQKNSGSKEHQYKLIRKSGTKAKIPLAIKLKTLKENPNSSNHQNGSVDKHTGCVQPNQPRQPVEKTQRPQKSTKNQNTARQAYGVFVPQTRARAAPEDGCV